MCVRAGAAALAFVATVVAALAPTACTTRYSYKSASEATRSQAGAGFALADDASTSALPSVRSPVTQTWIIARAPQRGDAGLGGVDRPGTGSLVDANVGSDGLPTRAFPLEATDVDATLTGAVASVDVTQRFRNPYADTIEAAYVFPLPHDAAVSDFVLSIGDRTIRGVIRDRAEAEKLYAEARAAGHVASLLTEERPNIFMEKVANIEPGASIDVTVTYFSMIDYEDGWFEWRLPLVVGPRFNPPSVPPSKAIGAVGVGDSARSGTGTSIEYLPNGSTTGNRVAIDVAIDAGVPIREIVSPSHAVRTIRDGTSAARVSLEPGDGVPNRDFVLRYSVAAESTQFGLVSSRSASGEGGHFALTVYPPATLKERRRSPVDLVFVVDRSGSMSGKPLAQVKAAIHAALDRMQPGDRFEIVDFGSKANSLGRGLTPYTSESVRAARAYVDALNADGGTMVLEGLNRALSFATDEGRVCYLVFLTDGFVSNEKEIIGALHKTLGPRRVFSFGIGSSANWYLLEGMANAGRGAVADISGTGDGASDAAPTMATFLERVSHPAMQDLSVAFEGATVDEVWPRRAGDLLVGRPVTVFGRYREGDSSARCVVRGWIGGERVELAENVTFARSATTPALERIWARAKIAQLADDSTWQPNSAVAIANEIRTIALEHGISSPFTAFVAVDGSRVTRGSDRRTIVQPVPMPEGVRYETTVDER
ncbi:MAG: VWA domain-containing protein [Phycisphaerae bacterium]|nr:VWA domain-containing protein [Phycisphaerae bacterium]